MKFPALPVRSAKDATLNFERLQLLQTSTGMAYRAAVQKIPSAVFTRIKVDTAIKDEYGHFDLTNGWYVVPADGYYQVSGSGSMLLAAKNFIMTGIFLSAVEQVRGVRIYTSEEATLTSVASAVIFARGGEKIELQFYTSGAEKELAELGKAQNQMTVMRVG